MVGLLDLIAHCTLLAAMLLGVLGFLFLGVGPRTGTYRTVTMLTGSMRPTYPVGS
ncbi:MAG: hypothetical protein QOE64_2973, partial [Frankiales bacterium]|nr:hypothetical protein [Frankiales bacterium]